MRVLFTSCPDENAFPHMVALARALAAAGHEVRVACRPGFAAEVTRAGLTAVPIGRDHDVWRAFGVAPGERAALRSAMIEPYDVAGQDERYITWEYLLSGYDYHVTWWHKMDNLPLISQLVAYAQQWRPDLVIWEPTGFAGSVAAKAVGAAHARLVPGVDIHGVTRGHFLRLKQDYQDPLADWLSGYAGKYGTDFSEDMVTGQVTINQLPGSLRLATDLPDVPMRYTPVDQPSPPGDVVVHDGDLTAFLEAVRLGLPQLVVPVYFDQPPLGDRIVECGAGLQLHPHTTSAADVERCEARLRTEPSFRDSAVALRDEMLTMPAPAEVVVRLDELAATHR
ncbi:nucleotide disphospho-sugar-binding domain-containing protein [Kibdelosporangium phytohabitans]|uniref:Erythromycin biosynthesis protein CIII-like N-terminal domain-containing protein n=1 Tax=Kibdelosporangium phytohabitans TaxID=860235 RepID=A0A0N9I0B2_9PSEU|nr:nucleotide disphospho-sugar-binding domain-containing protein [Kibdelosporangium phytohabitans]ALG09446.1 hypothetical protein AOZ06_23315 [Kibdelosporangium phytohabitans]MBE1469267.1 UDP:flavonoid glycosyltransferase YjiC (YdhE family) [Kibdelosporangium phytohabitans]